LNRNLIPPTAMVPCGEILCTVTHLDGRASERGVESAVVFYPRDLFYKVVRV